MLKNVMDVCLENDVSLIYVSSWEVFSGHRAEHFQADEGAQRYPRSVVGVAKSLGEDLLATAPPERLAYTIVRPARLYGGSLGSPRVLWNLAERCFTEEGVTLHKFHNGLALLDLLHVDDLARGIKSVVDRGATGVFHFGGGNPVTTKELVAQLAHIFENQCIAKSQSVNSWAANVSLKSDRANSELGWKPMHILDDGLAEIVQAIKTTKR
jgi:nucleoside-diphosphate-sugar epimerase